MTTNELGNFEVWKASDKVTQMYGVGQDTRREEEMMRVRNDQNKTKKQMKNILLNSAFLKIR